MAIGKLSEKARVVVQPATHSGPTAQSTRLLLQMIQRNKESAYVDT
jgi:hypothetical protein